VTTRTDDVWGEAPYERFSPGHAGAVAHLVRLLPDPAGLAWLDVGAGTGEVALLAAAGGATVSGCDSSAGMLATARRRAAEQGLDIDYQYGDATALPYPDASFDVVTASFVLNLVADPDAAAAEVARVCRPGGRLGMLTVLPDRGQAEVFAVLLRYLPTPGPDDPDPYAWADEQVLERLWGGSFELSYVDGDDPQRGESGTAMWEQMVTAYGPAHRLAIRLDPRRRDELAAGVTAVYDRYRTDAGTVEMPRPYRIVLGTRRWGR
jgi:SAM-dependent methyltransferase